MPYNTRRKSLSLPSLGIQLPTGSRGRDSPLAPPAEQPPQKKIKRIHSSQSSTSHRQNLLGEPTPPPSPPPESSDPKINHEGVNDVIVSAAIAIIERNGNRPHTVKELAERLLPMLGIVENSANPHAIISSRLNAYMKRNSFTDEYPCLLAKELITTHPRRIYFYLTTCPAQPIPDPEPLVISPNGRRAVVSPELSDDEESTRRRQLSPSPEVDLSSPEFCDEDAPQSPDGSSSSGPTSDIVPRNKSLHQLELMRRNILSSPPLEGDEQEFTQVGIMLKQRSASREYEERQWRLKQQMSIKRSREEENSVLESIPTSEEDLPQHDGHDGKDLEVAATLSLTTSGGDGLGSYRSWVGDVQSPESVELDELDDLLGAEFA